MKFSERQGIVSVRTVLQTDGIDDALRNRLWNIVQPQFNTRHPSPSSLLINEPEIQELFRRLWNEFFKEPTDRMGHTQRDALSKVRTYFFACEWHAVYDLIDFLAGVIRGSAKDYFIMACNKVLKEELSAYSFVSGQIVPITSEEEVSTIETAMAQSMLVTPPWGRDEQVAVFVVEGTRAARIVRKIAKGLYHGIQGQRLNDAGLLIFRDGDMKSPDFERVTRHWKEIDMGEEFRCRSDFDANGGAIWFQFYRFNWWLALTGEAARNYPRPK